MEVDYDELSSDESYELGKLCEMTGRFLDYEEELKIPNMYCSEDEIYIQMDIVWISLGQMKPILKKMRCNFLN
ncbi:hypothetical protein [Clostridium drakei]|uniref:Uncharacterized protein n=1 Tax=Clostridium drakei TaxID=332101 RepID=A0A2U8DL19_9CLOT|nr:hypothetical protein [Clostridium drakei]AWI03407.1 hypothetical protein B9W14_02490 [Clostridium drakei]